MAEEWTGTRGSWWMTLLGNSSTGSLVTSPGKSLVSTVRGSPRIAPFAIAGPGISAARGCRRRGDSRRPPPRAASVRRNSTHILEQPRQVQQVPRHERGIARGEPISGPPVPASRPGIRLPVVPPDVRPHAGRDVVVDRPDKFGRDAELRPHCAVAVDQPLRVADLGGNAAACSRCASRAEGRSRTRRRHGRVSPCGGSSVGTEEGQVCSWSTVTRGLIRRWARGCHPYAASADHPIASRARCVREPMCRVHRSD